MISGQLNPDRLFWAAALSAACMASLLLAIPRQSPPRYMPSLSLEDALMRHAIAEDSTKASKIKQTPALKNLQGLMREQAEHELVSDTNMSTHVALRARLKTIQYAHQQVLQQSPAIDSKTLLAFFMHDFDKHMMGRTLDHAEFAGSLIRVAERYGLQDIRSRTQYFVLRTWYKARLNHLWAQPATTAFRNIESKAYFGWLALRASQAPTQQRQNAFVEYVRLSGARAKESQAVFAAQQENWSEAYAILKELASPWQWRLRNEANYCLARIQQP